MLKERLTPCATLLYHWLLNRDAFRKLNLANFQIWSEEFLEERFSIKEVDRAFLRLISLGLVRIQNEEITVTPIDKGLPVKLQPLPKRLWRAWRLEERLAVGGMAIASAVLVMMSGFVLTQRPVQSQAVTGSLDPITDVAEIDL
ncbi:hypothetical protein Lepto7376_3565 [[Leptolyngbya] sp. PCC 7376]|uniref:hypothetical protein n=1 Tax=[Leptolyngbya] sp. PCC 7376 TaxID=111781 RepID=UPI00029F13A9|nr:hypothetical protein [[Leptolyngbya] sp. PCC 7376]AFY39756.1 hypothetical protein Lepto7376_3565 [[Leptolyngbya] sp. PCC 7376]